MHNGREISKTHKILIYNCYIYKYVDKSARSSGWGIGTRDKEALEPIKRQRQIT